ncbi:MAG: 16S rRNA (cytidine(1402)-2'-O)-methyltransferase [Acidimicrobiia bacterium]
MSDKGFLYVCATPIGNLGDISERLRSTLGMVDVVYAEDTRRTGKLLSHIGITVPMRSMFSGNESERTDEMLGRLEAGEKVALVSDAGMPSVSDPGADAVRLARTAGIAVTVIPGPSAVTTAVALSGFAGDRFVFEGFLPRKGAERQRRIRSFVDEERPIVLFVSPHRLVADLEALEKVLGSTRQVVVARELTKLHEEVWTGTLDEAIAHWGDTAGRGEFSVVIGPGEKRLDDIGVSVAKARALMESGESASAAAREAARASGHPRREIYEELLRSQERS